jgi:hypothetical protein
MKAYCINCGKETAIHIGKTTASNIVLGIIKTEGLCVECGSYMCRVQIVEARLIKNNRPVFFSGSCT